jgi:hypothetical protein
MSFLCPYCGHEKAQRECTREHPVPAHMGGNLEIAVCGDCNRGAAQHVDNPILHRDGDVRALRAMYDVRSPRHRSRRASDQFVGILSGEGVKAIWQPEPGGGRLRLVKPSAPKLEEDGTFTVVSPAENGERHLARALARLQEENPGKTVTLLGSEEIKSEATFEHSWGLAPYNWPRFMAKISIALGHLAIEGFDLSSEAKMLRWVMRAGRVHPNLLAPGHQLSAVPEPLEAGDRFRALLCPYEHLLAVAPGDDGLVFSAVFFGELRYQLVLNSELQPPGGGTAWVLDGRGRPWEADLGQTGICLAARFSRFGSAERLRSWRPRTRFLGRSHDRFEAA